MDASHIIARLIGPLLLAIGVGVLANRDIYRRMIGQFLAGYPFVYLSGVVLLVTGLAILNVHSHWTRDWRVLITLFGWFATIGGTFRIVAPHLAAFVGTGTFAQDGFLAGAGIILLLLGGFMTYKGYAAATGHSETPQ